VYERTILFLFQGDGGSRPHRPQKKKKKGGVGMEDIYYGEPYEDIQDYVSYVRKLRRRGREILLRHMNILAKDKAKVSVGGATPFVGRALNRNEGNAPTSYFRVYCPECGKVRSLIVHPSRTSVELRASCFHVVENAAAAVLTDSRLVYIGGNRVVPAGLAALLGEKVVG
jgi:hypothetical protein